MNDQATRFLNARNQYQGKAPRVLCLCSAGMLRSPTLAWYLSNPPYNFNTRAAGVTDRYALIPVDEVLIHWADAIICVDSSVARQLKEKFPDIDKIVHILEIMDCYECRSEPLIKEIARQIPKDFDPKTPFFV